MQPVREADLRQVPRAHARGLPLDREQRGRPPHAAYGVGMAAQGHDFAIPYRRTPDGSDPAVAWIPAARHSASVSLALCPNRTRACSRRSLIGSDLSSLFA